MTDTEFNVLVDKLVKREQVRRWGALDRAVRGVARKGMHVSPMDQLRSQRMRALAEMERRWARGCDHVWSRYPPESTCHICLKCGQTTR